MLKYIKREWKNGRWRYYYYASPTKNENGTVSIDKSKNGIEKKYFNNKKDAMRYEENMSNIDSQLERNKSRSARAEEKKRMQRHLDSVKKEKQKKANDEKMKGKNKVLKWLYKKGLYTPSQSLK